MLKGTYYHQQTVRRNNHEKLPSKKTDFFIKRNQSFQIVGLNPYLPSGHKVHPESELYSVQVLGPLEHERGARHILGTRQMFAGWVNALAAFLSFQKLFTAGL